MMSINIHDKLKTITVRNVSNQLSENAKYTMSFYAKIEPFDNIKAITNPAHYHDVPMNWMIAMTDVRGSTRAIENGQYKSVNAVAASSIMAILNAVAPLDIPYVFGGDGATMLVPMTAMTVVRKALFATKVMAKEQFDLDLRVGIVPVGDVIASGYKVRVAKLRLSENVQQAVFAGGGLSLAEEMLKDPVNGQRYRIEEMADHEADFSGFECRWSKIQGKYEEVMSLMVMATEGDAQRHDEVYHEVLHTIEEIYGDSQNRHPMTLRNLKLAFNPMRYVQEARVNQGKSGFKQLLIYFIKTLFASYFMNRNVDRWGDYRGQVLQSTDNEKFDDTLRMIISGNASQRQQLSDYLDTRYLAGELVYGHHISKHSMMTCLIFDRFNKHVHFVDGADGGYALAAKELKGRLKNNAPISTNQLASAIKQE